MKNKYLYQCLILTSILWLISCASPKPTEITEVVNSVTELESYVEKIFNESKIPGLSIAVIKGDRVQFQKALGYADLGSKREFSGHSIQNIASISKTIIAVAIMKAIDLGKLDLEDDINKYLPFDVINPKHPEEKITIKQLATHTSSILDTEVYAKSYYFPEANTLNPNDLPDYIATYLELFKHNELIDESVFLRNALSKEGIWYSDEIFSDAKPGQESEYSNIASTLAAYVVENAVGMSYEDFTSTYIFQPLGMTSTSWDFETTKNENFISRYLADQFKLPNYYLITKADGGLYTNTTDFSLFMLEMIKGYKGNGKILSKSSYTTMFSKQIELGENFAGGIFWELGNMIGFKHDGSDPGVTTFASYNSERDRGQILFSNVEADEEVSERLSRIWNIVGTYNWSE